MLEWFESLQWYGMALVTFAFIAMVFAGISVLMDPNRVPRFIQKAQSVAQLEKPLNNLLVVAYNWGQQHDFPNFKYYPQYNKIRAIGERANELDGMAGMQELAQSVAHLPGWSSWWWDEIGPWCA